MRTEIQQPKTPKYGATVHYQGRRYTFGGIAWTDAAGRNWWELTDSRGRMVSEVLSTRFEWLGSVWSDGYPVEEPRDLSDLRDEASEAVRQEDVS